MYEKAKENWELAFEDYKEGMKYKDIAEKYGVTLNTVKSWKTRKWNEEGVHTKSKKVCVQKKYAKPNSGKEPTSEIDQVMANEELTDKQRLFCLFYIKCFNATKAYQKAYECGYETAMVEGSNALRNPKVKSEINKLKQNRLNREFLAEEDIFQKYMDIAFADITDFVSFGQDKVPVMGAFGPLSIKDKDTGEKTVLTKTVNTVRFNESQLVDGTLIAEVKQGKDGASIKLLDKMKALDWIAKHMDIATEEQRQRIELIKAQTAKINEGNEESPESVVIIDDIPNES